MRPLTRRTIINVALAAPMVVASKAIAQTPFRFGLTPVLLDSDIALLDQMQVYLQEALAMPVDLIKRRTYQEITALLLSGELDAAWIGRPRRGSSDYRNWAPKSCGRVTRSPDH